MAESLASQPYPLMYYRKTDILWQEPQDTIEAIRFIAYNIFRLICWETEEIPPEGRGRTDEDFV